MRLLLALMWPVLAAATDLSGTWVGIWERQGESEGVCLYFLQGEAVVLGQVAYRHDKVSSVEAKVPVADVLDFAIAEENQPRVNIRLSARQTASGDTMLEGAATTGGRSESIALKKYMVPASYYRFGMGRTEPVAIRSSRPEYTPEARAARLQGTVELLVPVEPSGAVGPDIKVVSGLGLGLDEEAVKAARKWQFTPPHYDCRGGPTYVRLNINFKLP